MLLLGDQYHKAEAMVLAEGVSEVLFDCIALRRHLSSDVLSVWRIYALDRFGCLSKDSVLPSKGSTAQERHCETLIRMVVVHNICE
jgi:hypothetical protein